MKNISGYFTICFLACASISYAQDKDKGEFIEAKNEFYKEIKSELDKKEDKEPYMIFKMDQSSVNAPESLDEFKTVWCNEPISQGRTGTCWCFSTTSFYESEIFRMSKQKVNLSELYTVYWEYVEKAREFVNTRGESFFGEGSETNAVARMMQKYGTVPQEAYAGKTSDKKYLDHKAMFSELKTYLNHVKSTSAWNQETVLTTVQSILNYHMGEPPTEFTYQGTSYTPQTFLSYTGLKPDEYENFMSLMEKPYYQKAEYDVPDNWWNSEEYNNVPLGDFVSALKTSIDKGYSISIGGDVSESGYRSDNDLAMVPSYDIPSEYIDENARQFRFSNKSTTDDHAIHLIGYTEKDGDTWFLIKDSGSGSRNGKFKGYYVYHEDYIKLKMMTFTVHRDAVESILKKMKNI